MSEENPTGLKMYFFVPYNLSPIQQGIQAGHCAEQYALKASLFKGQAGLDWEEYVQNHKTWVILNGGTTNNSEDPALRGSMNKIGDTLTEEKIFFGSFFETDINEALTAICFLADERVWDMKNYPMYRQWCIEERDRKTLRGNVRLALSVNFPEKPEDNIDYMNLIGSTQNLAKKNLIYGKKLA